jgi:uncharacterized RDD family membrane protein YckC
VVGAVDVDQVVSRVDVERVLDEVDVDALVQRLDLDALLARVDVDALIQRVDIQTLLSRVDVNALAARIDVQALVDRVDVQTVIDRVDVQTLVDQVDAQAVIDRVDVQTVIDRVDVDAVAARVDVDAIIERVDVAAIASRAGIDDIVAEATRGVSTRLLALARRQIVALDLIVSGVWARIARPVSRLLAYFVDLAVISLGFAVVTAVLAYLVRLFSGDNVESVPEGAVWAFGFTGGYLVFAFFYWVIGLTIAGSSIGKALMGVRVERLDGSAITGRQALVRTIVYPLSFIFGLGLIPIVTARSHRALHDKAARTSVRYDWGDDTTTRAPLTAWLRSKGPDQWDIDDTAPHGGIGTESAPVGANGNARAATTGR